MPTHQPTLASWLRSHHGVVSQLQLTAMGITRGQRAALLHSGELVPVWEGVYRHAVWPDTFLSQCTAVCAADPTLVITCGGAGRFWGFRRCAHVGTHVSGTGTGLRFVGGPLHHRCPIMPIEHIHF